MSRRNFQYEATREPALRPDGKPYAEHLVLRVDELRKDDVVTEVGTIMSVEKHGKFYVVAGRLIKRRWSGSKRVEAIRRNWS